MNITAFDVASSFLGIHERAGSADHPFIRLCHLLTDGGEMADEVPWCSSFVNFAFYVLKLPRSRSKAARSWLRTGTPVELKDAVRGFDVVIFKRGAGQQPGPEVLNAPGHVALFLARTGDMVEVLGGNQGDAVSVAKFPAADVLGVRRLA